ncbi:tyrosine-type recombinase/integrase [Rhizobium rhizogenes]
MPRPITREGTTRLQFNKRLPADIRKRIDGKTVRIEVGPHCLDIKITPRMQAIRFSLGTADRATARLWHSQAMAIVEGAFAAWRRDEPIELTLEQITSLAGRMYRGWAVPPEALDTLRSTPRELDGTINFDPRTVLSGPNEDDVEAEFSEGMRDILKAQEERDPLLWDAVTMGRVVDAQIELLNVGPVTENTRSRLIAAFKRHFLEAHPRAALIARGDFGPDPYAARFPVWQDPKKPAALSVSDVLAGWWAEAKARGSTDNTYVAYSSSVKMFITFLGHDDALRVTSDDVMRYKNYRLTAISERTGKPVSARTIRDGDLATLRSVFAWAVENRKLTVNPAQGVNIRVGRKLKLRERDFTDAEAVAILRLANGVNVSKDPRRLDMARRWIPWLCAYSGCRVGELVQLRKEDIKRQGVNGWVMRITPEAGSVKSKEAREVPLHAHLVEMGFTDFVGGAGGGYLFIVVGPKDEHWTAVRTRRTDLAVFIRKAVNDRNVAPNHGWRHTFKTKGIDAGIEEKVLDALCGHMPSTEGRKYGTVSLKAKQAAMARFPRYEV